jgi:type I restriction enzyme M protein
MEYTLKLNSSSTMYVYGQELNKQTFAICKADMLIKGQDEKNIRR